MTAIVVTLALIGVALNVLAWWHVSLVVGSVAKQVGTPFDARERGAPDLKTTSAGFLLDRNEQIVGFSFGSSQHPWQQQSGPLATEETQPGGRA